MGIKTISYVIFLFLQWHRPLLQELDLVVENELCAAVIDFFFLDTFVSLFFMLEGK